MSVKQQNVLAVLDVGSAKVVALLAEVVDGVLRYRGHGVELARGMKRGAISELGPARDAMNKAMKAAEQIAGVDVEVVSIAVGGPHLRGIQSKGGISMGSRMKEITRDDVRLAIDRTRAVGLPPEREVLHLLPREFLLDEQGGIQDPVGMIGNRLEVVLQLVTCATGSMQSLITCANKASLEVNETVFEGLAAAEATLSSDRRDLGVCVVDIGAHSTELVVYFEGAVAHTGVLPIGGDHFTRDLAAGLRVSVSEAEALKRTYGNCVVTSVPQLNEIEIGGDLATGSQAARLVRQRFLAEILEPRARELLIMLRDHLREVNVLEALGAGCVFTGGGSHLVGLLDHAESLLRVPAHIGFPVPLNRMPPELAQPEFAVAIGTMLYTQRVQASKARDEVSLKQKLRGVFAGSI